MKYLKNIDAKKSGIFAAGFFWHCRDKDPDEQRCEKSIH